MSMNQLQQSKVNIPKLRFFDFEGKWQKKTLGEYFERVQSKNKELDTNVLTISAQRGLVKQETFFNKLVSSKNVAGYFLLQNGDFAYNKSYSKGYPLGAIKRLNKYQKGIVSPLYICFRIRNNMDSGDYFEKYFDSGKINREISKIAQEGARNHGLLNISVKEFFENIKITTPNLIEQQKIASFLESIDSWIGNLKSQKESLEKYKKGIMQKIFAQEIRFKDENGKDFPDWEVKLFKDIFSSVSTKRYQIKNSDILASGRFRVVDQGQGQVAGYSNNEKFLFRNKGVIVFGDHTTIIKYIDFDFIVGADGTKLLKNNGNHNLKYLFYVLSFYNIKSEGYKRHFSILSKIKIVLPTLTEQQKISSFLSSLDDQIQLKVQQIEKAEQWKKGLMQGLFV
jgi:type I restriction enzyme S subunit